MRNPAALSLVLVLAACGQGVGVAEPEARRLPPPPSSVVFGPADAPTGGTLVVGLLVPTPPSERLVDLVPPERMTAFLAAAAERAATGETDESVEELEKLEEIEEVWPLEGPDVREHRKNLSRAGAAVEEATGVRVLFRDVLATECDAVPVLLSAGRVVHEADRESLRPWLAAGGRLFCSVCFEHDFGESRPGVLPDEKESVDILVETCKEILATSERVARLPHDPRELLEAAREGDDVLVTFREVPASTAVRDLEDAHVADVVTGQDGQLRFRAPDGPRDPFFHRLVATWKGEGWTLRRAWRIVDLVGTAERFVFAPKAVEAGATFAPRVLFLNSLTGAPVPGREARLALLVDGEVVTKAVGHSGPAGSVDATLDVPAELEPGPAELRVGEDRFPVQVQRTLRVAVVTDRTLYRATDEVCIRVMVHDAARGKPVAGREVVLRLGDEERTVETSTHGIASARMHLVEARLGDTNVTAEVGGVKAQARFTVRGFERPTFLVTTEPEQLVLRAGEAAPVIVRVRAVNGSPLAGARVSVTTGRGRGSNGLTDAQGGFEYTARAAPDARVHRITVRDVDGRYAEHELHIALEGARAELELRPLEEPVVGRPCRFEVVGSAPGSVTLTSGDEVARTVSIGAEGRTIVEITPAAKSVRGETSRSPATLPAIETSAPTSTSVPPASPKTARAAAARGAVVSRPSCGPSTPCETSCSAA